MGFTGNGFSQARGDSGRETETVTERSRNSPGGDTDSAQPGDQSKNTNPASNHGDDCDTWVYPLVQMSPFRIGTDDHVTQTLWKDAGEETQIYLASGYFNLPTQYENVILTEAQAVFNILTAHPTVSRCPIYVHLHLQSITQLSQYRIEAIILDSSY